MGGDPEQGAVTGAAEARAVIVGHTPVRLRLARGAHRIDRRLLWVALDHPSPQRLRGHAALALHSVTVPRLESCCSCSSVWPRSRTCWARARCGPVRAATTPASGREC